MNKNVLLIGGEANGVRMAADTNPIRICHVDGPYSDNEAITEFYHIFDLAYGLCIGVHDKMTAKEALTLLIDKYPKQRKKSNKWKRAGNKFDRLKRKSIQCNSPIITSQQMPFSAFDYHTVNQMLSWSKSP